MASFDVFCVKIGVCKNPPPKKKSPSRFVPRGAKSRMLRTETLRPILTKFCMVVDIYDIVTYRHFGYHQLKRFWVTGGQISHSPIDFHRRPYNTLALPCERVIDVRTSLMGVAHAMSTCITRETIRKSMCYGN